jgi:iron(III) transport system substrate-binding protein
MPTYTSRLYSTANTAHAGSTKEGPMRRPISILAIVGIMALSACGGGGNAASQSASAAASGGGGASAAPDVADSGTIDELYKEALKEGGKLVYFGVLAQENARLILPKFEQRFPGIKVEHVDATSDQLIARAVAERRGGAIQGDVLAVPIENILQAEDAKLLLQWLPPEADAFDAGLKGTDWVGIEEQYWVGAWNTNLVKKADEPDSFEDFADAKYKDLGGLIAEPRDWEMILAMKEKYGGDGQKAIDLFKQIAQNNEPTFHKGHSDLSELLVSGQAAACFTCYSHQYPPRIKDGAPVGYFLTEGVGKPVGNAVFDGAPHPLTAKLWSRWVASEEGQKVYSEGGRTPTHPNVDPQDPVRPERIYHITADSYRDAQTADGTSYQDVWNEIFNLR